MPFTVFLGNLPAWVTADDIRSWLIAENLVADEIKVIRNPETQESKGFAFVEAPNQDEMAAIIKRFDRAPLEDRLLRANPAQPPKGRRPPGQASLAPGAPPPGPGAGHAAGHSTGHATGHGDRPPRRDRDRRRDGDNRGGDRKKKGNQGPPSAFAEELSKVL